MLFSRYNNCDFILNLDFDEGYEIITKAFDKREEEKVWQMWLVLFPNMTEKTFISFNDYYDKLKTPISIRSKEDILEEVYKIRKKLESAHK